ncbi:MAG: class F420-dependent oxidoreductase [Mycobacterium sp.]|nr:class F420-dependent oxidoreductase [Mycobacterium sp.]
MTLVPRDKVAEIITCGPDADKHAAQVRSYLKAGMDEVYVQQIGPDMDGFCPSCAGNAAQRLEKALKNPEEPAGRPLDGGLNTRLTY